MAAPPILEVRCTGCGETLEVEEGLTEFMCPDCATPQSLPPELMPQPRRRRALPLPRAAADARLPCATCGALLSVPLGLGCFACPVCGVELAVDSARLRQYLMSSAAAAAAAAAAVPLSPRPLPQLPEALEVQQECPNFTIRAGQVQVEPNNQLIRVEQTQVERPNQLIHIEQAQPETPDHAIRSKRKTGCSVGPKTASVEKRQVEPPNQVIQHIQEQPSNYAIYAERTQVLCPDRMIHVEEAQLEPPNHAIHREAAAARIELINAINETIARHSNRKTGCSVGPKTNSLEKRQVETANQVIQQTQEQPSDSAIRAERTQTGSPDRVIHVEAAQLEPLNYAINREKTRFELINETIARHSKRKPECSGGSKTISVEKTQVEPLNQVIQQVQEQPSDCDIHTDQVQVEPQNEATVRHGKHKTGSGVDPSAIYMEQEQAVPPNDSIHTEQVQVEPRKQTIGGTRKRKKKGFMGGSNEGLQLRRSKRLAKESVDLMDTKPVESEPIQQQAASPNQNPSHPPDIGRNNARLQLRHSKRLAKGSAGLMDTKPVESEPIQQQAASPNQNLSHPPDIGRNNANQSPTSLPQHEIPQATSNESDNLDVTTPTASSNPSMSEAERFARCYSVLYPPEVRRALDKRSFNSSLEHQMLQASSNETHPLDSTDSEVQPNSRQTQASQRSSGLNAGAKKKIRRVRGPTLCLKVWTLSEGERIPISLNTVGQPVGKEATILSNFLGTLARDGKLAPLTYDNWRRLPQENKEIMWHIVKLKFDIAPVGEFWTLKCLARKWKNWKATLKREHYDVHETEEERLADRDPRVLEEHWPILVSYWSTEKAMAKSARNKAIRAKLTTIHTTGTKSFARIREEERQKRPNKDEPSRADMFILTHTPKDGKPMSKAASNLISRLREQARKQPEGSGSPSTKDVFAQVMGAEKMGRVRTYGLGPCPNDLWGKGNAKTSFRQAVEASERAEDEASALRKKMMVMEESQRKLQEDLASMKSAVSAMRHMLPIDGLPDELTGEPLVPPGFQHVSSNIVN